jgi:hypothetical protein
VSTIGGNDWSSLEIGMLTTDSGLVEEVGMEAGCSTLYDMGRVQQIHKQAVCQARC